MTGYTRRRFIGTTAAGIGAALFNSSLANTYGTSSNFDPYERIELGKTSIRPTRLCMGTGMRGWKRESNLTRMGYDEGVKLVRMAYEQGVRMFDAADLYGTHGIVGKALSIYPRKDYVIFTKIWFAKNGIPEEERPTSDIVVKRFLKELNTDYIDGVMLHCVTSKDWNTELSDYMTGLDKLKQEGTIRSHGLTCHSLQAVETAVSEPWVDCINVRFNAYGNHMDDKADKVEPVVRSLHQAGKGVIAMKVMGQGDFGNSDEQKDNSLRYVLGSGAVDVLDIGFDKIEHIRDTEQRIKKIAR